MRESRERRARRTLTWGRADAAPGQLGTQLKLTKQNKTIHGHGAEGVTSAIHRQQPALRGGYGIK